MFELIKMVGVSAVLSAGLVTASEMQPPAAPEPASAKIYTDRVPEGEATPVRFTTAAYTPSSADEDRGLHTPRDGKGNALGKATTGACTAQAWPHITPECLAGAAGGPARSGVRMITVEQRQGPNTSVLVRVPAADLARH